MYDYDRRTVTERLKQASYALDEHLPILWEKTKELRDLKWKIKELLPVFHDYAKKVRTPEGTRYINDQIERLERRSKVLETLVRLGKQGTKLIQSLDDEFDELAKRTSLSDDNKVTLQDIYRLPSFGRLQDLSEEARDHVRAIRKEIDREDIDWELDDIDDDLNIFGDRPTKKMITKMIKRIPSEVHDDDFYRITPPMDGALEYYGESLETFNDVVEYMKDERNGTG